MGAIGRQASVEESVAARSTWGGKGMGKRKDQGSKKAIGWKRAWPHAAPAPGKKERRGEKEKSDPAVRRVAGFFFLCRRCKRRAGGAHRAAQPCQGHHRARRRAAASPSPSSSSAPAAAVAAAGRDRSFIVRKGRQLAAHHQVDRAHRDLNKAVVKM